MNKKITHPVLQAGIVLGLACFLSNSLSAQLVTTTTYDGSGSLIDSANWDNGLPTNANPGLVSQTDSTVSTWAGPSWNDIAIRQTGGTVFAAGDLAGLDMRGGATDSGNKSILEIEDLSNTDFSTTNLNIGGKLVMWAQFGQGHELSLLSGYVTIGEIFAVSSAALSTINLRDGKMEIATIQQTKMTVNLLSGGTGQIIFGDQAPTGVATAGLNDLRLNFETGFEGSLTIVQDTREIDNSAGGYWDFFVQSGWASIDGISTTDLSKFSITEEGTSTTISIVPEPSSYALLAGLFAMTWIMLR